MRWIRYFLVFLTFFALAAQVAAAQEEKSSDQREAARQEWERMTPEERRQVLEAWDILQKMPEAAQKDRRKQCEALMQAGSEQDRRDLIERMKRVRKKVDEDKLEPFERFNRDFHSSLTGVSEDAGKEFDGLEEHFQRALYGYAFGRTLQVVREGIEEKLTPEEKKQLEPYRGREWWKQVVPYQMKWIMDDLPEAERKEIEALSPDEQHKRKMALFWKQAKKNGEAAREVVAKEVADLLDAPAGELRTALNELWGFRTIHDPAKREDAFRTFRNRYCRGRHHR